jgi:hypothetical protein
MLAPTCFDITLSSSWNVPSALWEMLNNVDERVVSSKVVRMRTTSLDTGLDTVMPKHVGATIHN